MRPERVLGVIALILWACSPSSNDDAAPAEDPGEPPVVDDVAEAPDDIDSEGTEVADEPDVSDEPDVPPVVEVPKYDFVGSGPWYPCTSDPFPTEAVTVDAYKQEYQYFGGEPNRREVELDVDFPETTGWAQIGLELRLECPESGLCDHWDRTGSLSLVLNPDSKTDREMVEIARHITPYRVGMCEYIDVTNLAPLLSGKQRLHSWIDTWVGPGHAQGEGWRVSARFIFYPGKDLTPSSVVNVWGRRQITVGEIEPDKNVDSQVEPFVLTPPAGAKFVLAHLTTTGHSFGNLLNCAEFCPMRHDLIVNGTVFSDNPWRDDCAQNPVSPQFGTWQHNRNGWCPGAIVVGTTLDITSALQLGQENTLDFDILLASGKEYDNKTPVDLKPYTEVALKLYIFE